MGLRRAVRGWIGMALAAVVLVAGAALGAHAAPAPTDPHQRAAQQEADRILTTFMPPPGSTRATSRPDPVPPDLKGPPIQSGATTQATSIAWYYTSATPSEVLRWVNTHLPSGSQQEGSGASSTGPGFGTFKYPTPGSSLIVTPEAGADGRTVIRLDATVIWTPSRTTDSLVADGATSVSVVTPERTLTSADPALIRQVVALLNALTPPVGGVYHCPMDTGAHILITLPGYAQADVKTSGCGAVTLTVPGHQPKVLDGGRELTGRVYALFGTAPRG